MRKRPETKFGLDQVRRYGGQEGLAGFGQCDVVGKEGEVDHITSIPRGYTRKSPWAWTSGEDWGTWLWGPYKDPTI